MATTVEWIPADILSKVAKLLNSEVDNLHLRSVCSSWRSSLPLPNKPLSFPLKLPPIVLPSDFPLNPLFYGHFADAKVAGDFVLDEITFYRISPPFDENSSNGWLLQVSSPTNSNSSFTLLNPVTMEKMEDPIPKQINLLDYRISEICNYHKGNFSGFKGNRVHVFGECFALEVEHGVKPKGTNITDDWVACHNMIGVYHSEDSGKEISPPSWLLV